MSIVMHRAPTWGRGEIAVHINFETAVGGRKMHNDVWHWDDDNHGWTIVWVGWWDT